MIEGLSQQDRLDLLSGRLARLDGEMKMARDRLATLLPLFMSRVERFRAWDSETMYEGTAEEVGYLGAKLGRLLRERRAIQEEWYQVQAEAAAGVSSADAEGRAGR